MNFLSFYLYFFNPFLPFIFHLTSNWHNMTFKQIKLQTCDCYWFGANLKVFLSKSYIFYSAFDETLSSEASWVSSDPSGDFLLVTDFEIYCLKLLLLLKRMEGIDYPELDEDDNKDLACTLSTQVTIFTNFLYVIARYSVENQKSCYVMHSLTINH